MSTAWANGVSAGINISQVGGNAVPGTTPPGMMPVALQTSAGQVIGAAATNADDNPGGYSVLVAAVPRIYNPGTAVFEKQRTPSFFNKTGSGLTNTTFGNPTTGKKNRVLAYRFGITGNAIQAAAGVISVNLREAVGGFDIGVTHYAYVPSAAPAAPPGNLYDSGWVVLTGNGYLASAINNGLYIGVSNALTAGSFWISVLGTEE